MDLASALAYLEERGSYDKTGFVANPSTDTIERVLSVLGDPQFDYRVVHVTGTNGKGSTTHIVTRLLMAHGLKVGTYASPHLEDIRERIQVDCENVSADDFAAAVAAVADAEVVAGVRPSDFEIITAAAFRHFSDCAVDVAVVEVGMLGRWDATNVVRPEVAVITNIALDHTEFAGPTLEHIAREKAGIIKAGCTAVIGETRAEFLPVFRAEPHAAMVLRGEDFDVVDNELALGGRQLHIRTRHGDYQDLFLSLHGAHQGLNASAALAAVEEFFDGPVPHEIVQEAFASAFMPGRFEVVGHQPLVILDGAHNPAGADVCAEVFFTDFDPVGSRILVVGALANRDIAETLSALRADDFDRVLCATAPSPRARPAAEIADAARALGCTDVTVCSSVEQACDRALSGASADDAVLVAGSLYVVGAARPHLRRVLP